MVASTAYLIRQIDAGAEAVQIFESFGSALPPALFDRLSLDPIRRIVDGLKAARPHARVIVFVRGGGANLHRFAAAGIGDALALDWTLDPARCSPDAAARNSPPRAISTRWRSWPAASPLDDGIDQILASVRGRPHIFNLGHGILPETPIGTRLAAARACPADADIDMAYDWVKAVHVIAVISWMAGMLYLPRLFVYHCETPKGSIQSDTFKIMERRLLKAIMTPAMIVTWILGLILVWQGGWITSGWLHAKFAAGHRRSAACMGSCRKRFANSPPTATSGPAKFYRMINEVPTVLMIVIVILVIVKPF